MKDINLVNKTMGTLSNLPGLPPEKHIEAVFIEKSGKIREIIESGKGATTAGDNGSINVYMDDEGFIRCEFQQYMKTVNEQKFDHIDKVYAWANYYLAQCKGEPQEDFTREQVIEIIQALTQMSDLFMKAVEAEGLDTDEELLQEAEIVVVNSRRKEINTKKP